MPMQLQQQVMRLHVVEVVWKAVEEMMEVEELQVTSQTSCGVQHGWDCGKKDQGQEERQEEQEEEGPLLRETVPPRLCGVPQSLHGPALPTLVVV